MRETQLYLDSEAEALVLFAQLVVAADQLVDAHFHLPDVGHELLAQARDLSLVAVLDLDDGSLELLDGSLVALAASTHGNNVYGNVTHTKALPEAKR